MKQYKHSRLLALLLAAALLCAALAGCSGAEDAGGAADRGNVQGTAQEGTAQGTGAAGNANAEPGSWAIYWYLCGSDLESNYGAATTDIYEAMQVALPENVKVVIQSGGALEWQNEVISADRMERYVLESNNFEKIGELPDASMGDAQTLTEFLEFCTQNYPAEHQMLVFWNHGGGSISGVAFDERHEYDSLSLSEIYNALSTVFPDPQTRPFDIVGFDACLMATVDTANVLTPFARYLVASEETEPGGGWQYTEWLGALAADTGIKPSKLGMVICDSYLKACEEDGSDGSATLSLVDLEKVPALLTAYEEFGKEALRQASENPMSAFTSFGRAAQNAENYGGNTPEEGYTNMVDLGHLARNSAAQLGDAANSVLSALDDCVVYKVNGPYHQEATGLSCYYPYKSDDGSLETFYNVGASEAFKYFYSYAVTGTMDESGAQYVEQEAGGSQPEEVSTASLDALEDHALRMDKSGNAVLDLGPELVQYLTSVRFELCYFDPDADQLIMLGSDNDIDADWDNGVFQDNFQGVWGAIDGNPCYMELVFEGEDYNLYSVPILLNGTAYNLSVAYRYDTGEYEILGARKGLEESGMADKNLRKLVPGDEVTLLHYYMNLSDDSADPELIETFSLTVTENTVFESSDLGDGYFAMMFEMIDTFGNSYYSDIAMFSVEDGAIYNITE